MARAARLFVQGVALAGSELGVEGAGLGLEIRRNVAPGGQCLPEGLERVASRPVGIQTRQLVDG